jgi:hypothetical protein
MSVILEGSMHTWVHEYAKNCRMTYAAVVRQAIEEFAQNAQWAPRRRIHRKAK